NITGKGGVPANPNDALSSDSAQFNWVEPPVGGSQNVQGTKAEREIQPKAVIPAGGWVMDDRGQVTLVAYNTTDRVPQRSRRAVPVCRER
ncbi:hypothetical protein QUB70_23875, partial [Microcoleus sp. A003_D6]|uniref:hypothetical protein n=1 Tax=Microcoleus sp. A003_D6 TaxID=3055266 RepID=UPI002FD034D3